MIVKVLAGLATAAIVSAVAAHNVPATMDEGNGRPAHQQPGPAQAFPLAAKGDRPRVPGAQAFITIEHRAPSSPGYRRTTSQAAEACTKRAFSSR